MKGKDWHNHIGLLSSERLQVDDDGTTDELVTEAASVHIERMDDDHVWMRIDRGPDRASVVCHFWAGRAVHWGVEEE